MNVLLNSLVVGAVTVAASAAVVFGEPAMAELALAHSASKLDMQNMTQTGTPALTRQPLIPVGSTAP